MLTSLTFKVNAQLNGEVSYVTSNNVYVKFASTSGIEQGDTLYIEHSDDLLVPGLIVNNKSSISCVCTIIEDITVSIGDKVLAKTPMQDEVNIEQDKTDRDTEEIEVVNIEKAEDALETESQEKQLKETDKSQQLTGRITASSYASLRDFETISDPQLRYTMSIRGQQLRGSDIHFDSYLSFRHQVNHWDEVNQDFNRAFKVYGLSASLVKPKYAITIGRKVNRSISNIGAVDGLQFSYNLTNFTFGTALGTRPDLRDYGFNFSMPQVGVFMEHNAVSGAGQVKSTMGFFEQRSDQNTDRRFLYLQHSNSMVKNLYLFLSCELDLFKKLEEQAQGDFKLTSLYLSARYRFSRKYSLYLSYDNRQNIIYYETYKNTIDRLIEQETRQGFRLRFVARPIRLLSIGMSGTYRYQKNNLQPTSNAHIYINYSRIPLIKSSASFSYTYLNTYYLNSQILGLRFRRGFSKGRINLGVHYRWVNYAYKTSSLALTSHISGLDLSLQMNFDITLSINYELNINQSDNYQRIYLKLIKRIR